MNLFNKLNWIGNLLLTWWMNFLVEDFCLTYSSSALTRDSLTCVVVLMPWVLLPALLHRSWRVHKSTAFVVWVGHELQPLWMSSRIRRRCSSLCMSQTVSSRCGRLRVFAGAHVTFDSRIFYGVQNRTSCCSLFSHLWHNQQWCSIRTFHGPQSKGKLRECERTESLYRMIKSCNFFQWSYCFPFAIKSGSMTQIESEMWELFLFSLQGSCPPSKEPDWIWTSAPSTRRWD